MSQPASADVSTTGSESSEVNGAPPDSTSVRRSGSAAEQWLSAGCDELRISRTLAKEQDQDRDDTERDEKAPDASTWLDSNAGIPCEQKKWTPAEVAEWDQDFLEGYIAGKIEAKKRQDEEYKAWIESYYWAQSNVYDDSIPADSHKTQKSLREPLATAQYKRRFCASYPNSSTCKRGDACAFAHSRDEIRTPLLSQDEEDQKPEAMTNSFFMYKFKVLWCPIGVPHDWQKCVYAHNYQDSRRDVSIGYGSRPCPEWDRRDVDLEYSERCRWGIRCPFAHGAKELLYHPEQFRIGNCRSRGCKGPRKADFCAFYHNKSERRYEETRPKKVDYTRPLPEENIGAAQEWAEEFLALPFPCKDDQYYGEFPDQYHYPYASGDTSQRWPAEVAGNVHRKIEEAEENASIHTQSTAASGDFSGGELDTSLGDRWGKDGNQVICFQ